MAARRGRLPVVGCVLDDPTIDLGFIVPPHLSHLARQNWSPEGGEHEPRAIDVIKRGQEIGPDFGSELHGES